MPEDRFKLKTTLNCQNRQWPDKNYQAVVRTDTQWFLSIIYSSYLSILEIWNQQFSHSTQNFFNSCSSRLRHCPSVLPPLPHPHQPLVRVPGTAGGWETMHWIWNQHYRPGPGKSRESREAENGRRNLTLQKGAVRRPQGRDLGGRRSQGQHLSEQQGEESQRGRLLQNLHRGEGRRDQDSQDPKPGHITWASRSSAPSSLTNIGHFVTVF